MAIGLVHFSPHGRIVEICGETSTASTSGRLAIPMERGSLKAETNRSRPKHSSDLSVPARNLSRSESTVSIGSVVPKILLGRLCLSLNQSIGNIGVSFALPDVVLVLTGINQRRSISGSVPLLVPR